MIITPLPAHTRQPVKAELPDTDARDDFSATLRGRTEQNKALPVRPVSGRGDKKTASGTGERLDGLNALMTVMPVDITLKPQDTPVPPALPIADASATVQVGGEALPAVNGTAAGAAERMPHNVRADRPVAGVSHNGQKKVLLPEKQEKSQEAARTDLMLPDTRRADRKRGHATAPAASPAEASAVTQRKHLDMPVAPLSGERAAPVGAEIRSPDRFAHHEAPELSPAISPLSAPDDHVPVRAVSATGTLEPKLGTPGWQQALGHQISLFTRNGIQNAELRLHPEELGALQINLRLNNDQAQLHFITGNHQVRAALEGAMPHLRTLLDESGISLGQSTVSGDTTSWQNASRQQEHGQPSDQGHRGQHGFSEGSEPAAAEAESIQPVRVRMLPDGINTYA